MFKQTPIGRVLTIFALVALILTPSLFLGGIGNGRALASGEQLLTTCVTQTQPGVSGMIAMDSTSCSVPANSTITRATVDSILDNGGEVYINGQQVFAVSPDSNTHTDTTSISAGLFTSGQSFVVKVIARNSMDSSGNPAGQVYGKATVQVFGTTGGGGNLPTVVTQNATNITETSATLNGSVTPNGGNTTAWFQWGSTSGLGQETPHQNIGSGNFSQSINAYLSGLQNNSTYYFRAVAQNEFGGPVYGNTLSFTTSNIINPPQCSVPPFAGTGSAFDITAYSARLTGVVNPNGCYTTYWFRYGTDSNNLYYETSHIGAGSGDQLQDVSQWINGLQSGTRYYYRLYASNQRGTNNGSLYSFDTPGGFSVSQPYAKTYNPTSVSDHFATLRGAVNPNGVQTDWWFEIGTSYSFGRTIRSSSGGSPYWPFPFSSGYNNDLTGNYFTDVSANVDGLNANTTYYYRTVARNINGNTAYGETISFYTGTGTPPPSYGNGPTALTNSASNVSYRSATLRGTINPNGNNTTAWFEWGRTPSLGNVVGNQNVGYYTGPTSVSADLSGLEPNTLYYYRAVARNNYGSSSGDIIAFMTLGGYVPPVVPPYTPPPASGVSTVSLTPMANRSQGMVPTVDNLHPLPGDYINYTLNFSNVGTGAITNATLRVFVPAETDFISSNPYPSSNSANMITFNLGTLKANTDGSVTIQVRVKDNIQAGTSLNFISILDYLDPGKKPQSVSAPLTLQVASPTEAAQNNLATTAATMGNIPWYLWVLILVLFLIIIALSYVFYRYGKSRRSFSASV